jgi:hypothetical protein
MPNLASGPQNQPSAKVAVATFSGMIESIKGICFVNGIVSTFPEYLEHEDNEIGIEKRPPTIITNKTMYEILFFINHYTLNNNNNCYHFN